MTARDSIAHEVRMYVFDQAALTGNVPQRPEIARALGRDDADVRDALRQLADGKIIMLAPNNDTIWVAAPFCAAPSPFRVRANTTRYWGICIWDALGIPAALHADAEIEALCGDCGDRMALTVAGGRLAKSEGIVHFAIPARRWWDNIGFT